MGNNLWCEIMEQTQHYLQRSQHSMDLLITEKLIWFTNMNKMSDLFLQTCTMYCFFSINDLVT